MSTAANVSVNEERSLSDAYRWKDGDPEDLKPQGQGLNDLYVRFFRMAEQIQHQAFRRKWAAPMSTRR